MGKGARSREQNAGKKVELLAKKQAEDKKKKRNKIIISAISIVLVAAIATGGLVYSFFYGNGKYLRDNVVASTENFKVDNAMMTYFFRTSYEGLKATYGEYISMVGIDTTKSLKKQNSQDGATWFDYLLNNTKTGVEEMLVLAEKAKAEGLSLNDSDRSAVKARADSMADSFYSGGVQKQDVEKALEIQYLAQKYRTKFNADTQYSSQELTKYFDENKNTYMSAGYRAYSVPYEAADAETESSAADTESSVADAESSGTESSEAEEPETVKFTQDEAKAKAEALKAVTTEDAYLAKVKELAKEQEPTLDEEALTGKADGTLNSNVTFTADDEVSDWVFGSGRKVGDTYMRLDETSSLYRVYYLTALPTRNEAPTVNVRHILLSLDKYGSDDKAKAKADEMLALAEADKTEEGFASLAAEHSDDTGSSMNGGLYSAVKKGDMVAEFEEWSFDAAREPGDVGIVKTEYGYHVMYFSSKGGEVWQETVASDMRSTAYDAALTELKTATPITYDDVKMQDIPA